MPTDTIKHPTHTNNSDQKPDSDAEADARRTACAAELRLSRREPGLRDCTAPAERTNCGRERREDRNEKRMTLPQRNTVAVLAESGWRLLTQSGLLGNEFEQAEFEGGVAEDVVQQESTPESLRAGITQLYLGRWEALVIDPTGRDTRVVPGAWAVKRVSTSGYTLPAQVEEELAAVADGDPFLLSLLRSERKRDHFGLDAGSGDRPDDSTRVHLSPGLVFVAYTAPAPFADPEFSSEMYGDYALRTTLNMMKKVEVLLVRRAEQETQIHQTEDPRSRDDAIYARMDSAQPPSLRVVMRKAVFWAVRDLRCRSTPRPTVKQVSTHLCRRPHWQVVRLPDRSGHNQQGLRLSTAAQGEKRQWTRRDLDAAVASANKWWTDAVEELPGISYADSPATQTHPKDRP